MPSKIPPAKRASNSAAPGGGSFGPALHNAWALRTEEVSLVRKPLQAKPVRFEAQPQAIEIDLARSALVVVDMQNDFCHPDGWFGQRGLGVRAARKPIATIAGLLPSWRAAGGAVVWLNWGIRADVLNLSPTIRFKGKAGQAQVTGYAERSPRDKGRALVAGDWGAQVIDELPVAATDITIHKHRLSGFWDNDFDTVLRHQGITTLLFAGVNTDRCVYSTLQDAAFIGYDCVLLADACSSSSPAYVSRAIHFLVQQLLGFVATAAALQLSLAAGKGPRRAVSRSRSPSSST